MSNIDYFFPNFNKEIADDLYDILIFFDENDELLSDLKFYFSTFAIPILIFHLVILTRKSMRHTSINVILAGLALVDILIMFCNCFAFYRYHLTRYLRCDNFDGFWMIFLVLVHDSLNQFMVRLSTWLAVGLPFLWTIIIKFGVKYISLKTSKVGYIFIAVLICFDLPFTIAGSIGNKIEIIENDILDERCGLPNFTYTSYQVGYPEWTKANDFEYFRRYVFVDAIFTKHIPAFLSPFLTVILIREMGRLKEKRNEVFRSESCRSQNNQTTRLVLFMTIFFVIINTPLGIFRISQAFFLDQHGVLMILYNISRIFEAFSVINAVSHCILFFLMSKKYRITVSSLFTRSCKQRVAVQK
ncbi:unnamed protein product [Caenorhabditis angaria]|uniref:G-protein coupled receptors family 1 profile domain-containing protein n=1 Tax=Caenorhabditis angaria TaxID=860376 RepID=A0A9P1J122_9PELO|nr:unnamed protein product [Caenorhabditis angaria]